MSFEIFDPDRKKYRDSVESLYKSYFLREDWSILKPVLKPATIPSMKYKKVIYNDPATIVLWEDGTKTVVKCEHPDTYDPEKGLALCFMKKALGNKSRALNDVLHKEKKEGAK